MKILSSWYALHLWDFKRAGIQIWDFWKPKMSDTGEHNESYLIQNSVLARFLESFTCLLRKWKCPLKLHYKRSLGSWAAQLCSGVRGDSSYHHEDLAMDRLLVSDCLSKMLACMFISMNKPLLFVCSEPCYEIHGFKTSSSLWLLPFWGHGGRVN